MPDTLLCGELVHLVAMLIFILTRPLLLIHQRAWHEFQTYDIALLGATAFSERHPGEYPVKEGCASFCVCSELNHLSPPRGSFHATAQSWESPSVKVHG